MKKTYAALWLLLLLLVLALLPGLSAAQDAPDVQGGYLVPAATFRAARAETFPQSPNGTTPEHYSGGGRTAIDLSGLRVGEPELFHTLSLSGETDVCGQLLANPRLDVIEFQEGGTAEPWVVLDDVVYYSDIDYTSPKYSLFLADFDSEIGVNDPSPFQDAFGQGFLMPNNLTKVTIEYNVASLDSNGTDKVSGELWALDQGGFLDAFLGDWTISDSEGIWEERFVEITNPADLQVLQGRALAVILVNATNNQAPGEWTFFDDITLTACVKETTFSGKVFLPNIFDNFGTAPPPSQPVCLPPTENPQDQFNSDRGLVETGATCNTSLSNIDRADYYTFKPDKTGQHTLRLTNLPAGTEWSAMIFTDTPAPEYAPGATDGQCRIAMPGSGDKQVVCTLQKDQGYFVKVSAGSTPVPGNYRMRVTAP